MSEPIVPTDGPAAKSASGPPRLLGLVLMAALILGWGMNWPATKVALNEMEPLMQRGIALAVGGIGLLVLARVLGFSLRVPAREFKPLAIVTVLYVTGWHVTTAYGISLMAAGRASIIGNTIPLWVAILGYWIMGEALTGRRIAGFLLGFIGLGVLFGPDIVQLGFAPLGSLLMLAAAILTSAGSVAMRYYSWRTPLTVLTGWSVLLGGIPLYIGAIVLQAGPTGSTVSLEAIAGLVYTIAIATIFGHWCWFKIMTLYSASVGSAAMFGVPIVGVISSALYLREPVGWPEIAALALVLAGIACVLFGKTSASDRRTVQPIEGKPL